MDTTPEPEKPKNSEQINVKVSLDGLLGALHRDVQRVTNLVAVGIQSPVTLDDDSLAIRSETISFRFGSSPPWASSDDARSDYQDWVFGNGLRDVIEGVGAFLEEVRKVLVIWSLGDRQTAGERLTGAAWNEELLVAAKRFHRLGFPDKLESLRSSFHTHVDSTLDKHVLSVNAARNCLVHRRGIVSERDVNRDGALTIKWRRAAVVLQDEDGEHPLVLGQRLAKDSIVVLKNEDCTREFKIGERIVFTSGEFTEICWSLFLYSFAWGEVLNKVGLDRGYVSKPLVRSD